MTDKTALQQHLDQVYHAQSAEDLAAAYGAWADTYDADLVGELSWDAPERAADYLSRHLEDRGARILDVGAGTGLVGQALAALGYQRLAALDLSEVMLEKCRARGVYDALHRGVLGESLPLADSSHDAIIAAGVFTQGHATPSAFPELLRVLRTGGLLVFTLRPDLRATMGFDLAESALVTAGTVALVEESPFLRGFNDLQTKPYQVWVYRKC